jgi:hypothetical protein
MKSAPIITSVRLNQQPADPEVPEVVKRRKHAAAYKLRILKEAGACTDTCL